MTTDSLVGQILGKYKIIEHLGRGGMAEVYKGYREDLDRTVAIKLMHAFLVTEEDFLFRFKREARAMAQLRHPNIVSVYDFDVYGENTYYLVMEYIGGGTLKEKLTKLAKDDQRLSLEQSARIALEVADALTYAHEREMVHRDIKPANIMLDENEKAILTDFGIVKLVGGQGMTYTATGALIGTPAYMSPEQALGKPGDARSDLYSLGILLFQMVTGQLPFEADTPLAVVMKHVNDPAPLPITFNPDVPAELQEIIIRAMAKDPEERYQSAGEMAAALRSTSLLSDKERFVAAPNTTLLSDTQVATHDTPTSQTSVASTAISSPGKSSVAQPPAEAAIAAPETAASGRGRSLWWLAGAGLAFLLIATISSAVFGVIPGLFGRQPSPTATIPLVAAIATPTSTVTPVPPSDTPVPPTPTDTPTPVDTPDVVASSVAAIVQTAAARPTDTPKPTSTPTATATATPNATATYLAGCVYDVELVTAYTYRENVISAPVNTNFPVNWVLRNSGTCPWPADLSWTYFEGTDFGFDGTPIQLEGSVAPEEEVPMNIRLLSPAGVNAYESTWHLVNAAGESFGPPLSFEVRTYVPATPTPTRPPATPTSAAATPEPAELAWHFAVGGCEYRGTEWRCMLTMTPYGGGGGPYTIWVFDADQPAEYRGPGPFTHFAGARRCSPYIHEIKVQDDATGTSFSENIFIDPDSYFEGGCVLP